jgi:signal transduction histidine kinase/ligand-binding sensor domain-containing protein/DNA-binding response OmpR family regulator
MQCFISFLIFIVVASDVLGAQKQYNYNFKHLSIEDGLLNNTINSIESDREGFIWIATQNGLHKFDGYDLKIFTKNANDSTSIQNNNVVKVIQGEDDILWVGTNSGLDLFNKKSQNFKHIPIIEENLVNGVKVSSKVYSYYVNFLYKSPDNNIYVGTRGSTLYKLDKKNRTIKPFLPHLNLNENLVKTADSEGNIYVASAIGVYQINTESEIVKKIPLEINDTLFSNYDVFYIFYDSQNCLWISCNLGLFKINDKNQLINYNFKITPFVKHIFEEDSNNLLLSTDNGLFRYNHSTDEFYVIRSTRGDGALGSNKIRCVHVDDKENLWVGTENNGISYVSLKNAGVFKTFSMFENASNKTNSITEIYKDNDRIWLASDGSGTSLYNSNFSLLNHYNLNDDNKTNFHTNSVLSIFKDKSNVLWFGGYYGGLLSMDENNNFKHYNYEPLVPAHLKNLSKEIKMISQFEDGQLLIATNGAGVINFDKKNPSKSSLYINEAGNQNSLSSNFITSILPDENGVIWVGTYFGLNKWDTRTNIFTRYFEIKDDTTALPSNVILCLYKDKNERLWIGTDNGLCLFNEESNKFHHYGKSEGIHNSNVTNILDDNEGNIWVSTLLGISRLNLTTNKFKNYTYNDGLSGNEFIENSCFKDEQGTLYFGSTNGITYFSPDDVKNINKDLSVYISDVLISNKSIRETLNWANRNERNDNNNVILKHNQSFLTFKFLAINYNNPRGVNYAYKLDGFDDEWHFVGNKRIATYSNLQPGQYTFSVMASYADGKWFGSKNDYTFKIKPPIWQTKFAYVFYLLFITFLYFVSLRIVKIRNQLKQQIEVQRIKAEHEKKLHNHKQRFFMNVSHDLRTPLSLIIPPIESLLSSRTVKSAVKKRLFMVYRNASHLLSLINELMDFTIIDNEKIEISAQYGDLVKFTKEIFILFEYEASIRQIKYQFNANNKPVNCWFDTKKMERVILNLIANAFKFTPDNGEIVVEVSEVQTANEKAYAQISVSDNGCGISEENQTKIFERFYQIQNNNTNHKTGTGIGLSLVKRFIELHHGKVEVNSKKWEKTSFICQIPLGNNHFSKSELVNEPVSIKSNKYFKIRKDQKNLENEQKDHTILIVEDNPDLRDYLCELCQNDYKTLSTDDGEKALELILDMQPDLIISDVILPNLSGLELCKAIKNDEATCHIPIILLTARVQQSDIIQGIETGADAYLTKPFNVNHLLVQVKKLLETRSVLFKKFSKDLSLLPKELAGNKFDQQYMEKVISFIEENILNENLTADQVANHVNLSHSQTYRKIKSLTGQNINYFIRNIRIKKALNYFEQGEKNIADVAMRVGFSSPAYFSKCFKEQVGKTPTDYLRHTK